VRIEGLLLIVVVSPKLFASIYCSSISYFQISGKVRAILICFVSFDWDLMANVSVGMGNEAFEESVYTGFHFIPLARTIN
jgi:hypothetical protein